MSRSSLLTGSGCLLAFGFLVGLLFVADSLATFSFGSHSRDRSEESPRRRGDPTEARAKEDPKPSAVPPSRPLTPEAIEVFVAARDLSVGTVLTGYEKLWVAKKTPRDGVPPGAVTNPAELADKRLTRSIRAGETILARDLGRPGSVLPSGTKLFSLQISDSQATAGFVVPGGKVDAIATFQTGNALRALLVTVNTLVVAVDVESEKCVVSLAVTDEQERVLALAVRRGCVLELLLRQADTDDTKYDVDAVIKSLESVRPLAPAPRPVPAGR